MKRYSKILISSLLLVSVMFVGQSCEKWLDVKDFNKISREEAWQTKEFVAGIVSGAYARFQSAAVSDIFYWGELRGDCIARNTSWSGDDKWVEEFRAVKEIEITDENSFAQYGDLYSVINRCNQVIDYAPGVMALDDTYKENICKQQIAEMKWLRCLCYFYLVRAFRDVPYVTEAVMDDVKPFAVAKTDGYEIMRKLVLELEDITRPKAGTDPGGDLLPIRSGEAVWASKGRATTYAAFALIADISLWLEDYEKADLYCTKILNNEISLSNVDGLYALVPTFTGKSSNGTLLNVKNDAWYNELFAKGNSIESIMEVQWTETQVNPVMGLMYHKDGIGKTRLLIPNSLGNTSSGKLFGTKSGQTRNVRGENRSIRNDLRIWKYSSTSSTLPNPDTTPLAAATSSGRSDANRNPNYIIYRLAEVYLMKAEALIMKGDAHYADAYDLINAIRERGGFDAHPAIFTSEGEALQYLLLERQREFLAEGKRWFDLVRVALKNDAQYKDVLIDLLVADIPAQNRDVYRGKLQNPYGYFFPIYKDEIDSSKGVIEQNEYYK